MINWQKAKETRPKQKQGCFITVAKGMFSAPIIGPVYYEEVPDLFVDLFATAEAGTSYSIEGHDLWWCDEEEINLPEDEEAQ